MREGARSGSDLDHLPFQTLQLRNRPLQNAHGTRKPPASAALRGQNQSRGVPGVIAATTLRQQTPIPGTNQTFGHVGQYQSLRVGSSDRRGCQYQAYA
eukprot:3941480-Rhodomonas_salina.2